MAAKTQMYKVDTKVSSLSGGKTYTAPTKSTAGYENGIHSITFKVTGGSATLHDSNSFLAATQVTFQENESVTFNERYLEGKNWYWKSTTATIEVLIVPGMGT